MENHFLRIFFFLQLLERMDHSFAEDGTWLPPTLVVAPDFMKKNKPIIEGFENDAEFLSKRDEIIVTRNVRNGVLERLVENWLTKVNEKSFQVPFCQLLTTEGYKVVHCN